MSVVAASAWHPIISEDGNGHGCDEWYLTFLTAMPASSRTSRATASSTDSPWSMNPASAEYIRIRDSRPRDWPSRHRSPSWTSMIATGSVRGKCSAPQSVHLRT